MDPSAALQLDQPAPHWAGGCRRPRRVQSLLRRRKRHPHALHRRGAGPARHPAAWLPYLWYMWRRQIAASEEAGFRVVVPDQRGFGQTDRPDAIEAYDISQSVGDMVGLMAAIGETSAVIVGHDLGAWVAQAAAMMRPDLFRALVMLNTRCRRAERSNRPSPCRKWRRARCTTTCTSSRSASRIESCRRSAQDVAKRLLLHLR